MENEEMLQEDFNLQPKFVVETTLNAKVQLDASKAVQTKAANVLSYVCIGLCAVMSVALIVLYFTNRNTTNLVLGAVMIAAVAFMIYNKYSMPKKYAIQWEQNISKTFGSNELHLTMEFYELSLVQTMQEDAENIVDAGYSELVQMKETEDLFLIRCKNRQWFFLSKKGFRLGSADSFRRFIEERIGGK